MARHNTAVKARGKAPPGGNGELDLGGGGGSDTPAPLHEEARRRYLNYALCVITSRALPDVRDGLKPVQRRILYAMYARPPAHAGRQVPQVRQGRRHVMGQYHPHGDIGDLRRAGAHGAGLLAALPAGRRARQLRLARRRLGRGRCATPSAGWPTLATELLARARAARPSTSGPTTTARRASRSCCRRGCRSC